MTERQIDAGWVSQMANGDHRLHGEIEAALQRAGYAYDIHYDVWRTKPVVPDANTPSRHHVITPTCQHVSTQDNPMPAPRFYDIRTDGWREVTQQDVDQFTGCVGAFGLLVTFLRKIENGPAAAELREAAEVAVAVSQGKWSASDASNWLDVALAGLNAVSSG